MKRHTLFIIMLSLSSWAYATDQNDVAIVYLNINRDLGQVFLRTSIVPTINGCHTNTDWSYTFTLASEADKAAYSTLLAAKMAGKTVNVVGFGTTTCAPNSNIEELRWVTVN